MNENLTTELIGKSVPEAVGMILRENMDFRIEAEDDWRNDVPPAPDPIRVNLSIQKNKISAATIG